MTPRLPWPGSLAPSSIWSFDGRPLSGEIAMRWLQQHHSLRWETSCGVFWPTEERTTTGELCWRRTALSQADASAAVAASATVSAAASASAANTAFEWYGVRARRRVMIMIDFSGR